jgi:hypothetical protein
MHLYKKAHEVHYQDLLRQAENEGLLKHLPRHHRNMIRRTAGKLGILLLKLGARLKQIEQSPTVLEDHRTLQGLLPSRRPVSTLRVKRNITAVFKTPD